jgi:hypothetical protein
MTKNGQSFRSIVRGAITLAVAAALYEAAARSGYFAPALMPTLPAIARTLFAMIADGSMIEHAAFTLYRVMFGFSLAVVVGIPLGILMARFQRVENFFLPLVSALMPIPSFALVPLFMLWFGIGNLTTIMIVFYAATFPMLFNTWSGVRSVNPIWLRAARRHGRRRAQNVLEGDHPRRFALHHYRHAAGLFARLDRGDRRRDDRGFRLGAGLGDLRRQGISQHRHHAGLARRHRRHRLPVRTPGVRFAGARHGSALGHGARGQGVK